VSTSPSVQFVSFYFRNNFQHCRKWSRLTFRLLSLTISAPSRSIGAMYLPTTPVWSPTLQLILFRHHHFLWRASAYNFISFRFVRVNCPVLTRGPPTLNTTNRNCFGFRFRNRIIRFLNPRQFQKSDPVVLQFLLTGTGTGGSNCPTGVKPSNHRSNCTQVLVYPNNHNFLWKFT